MTTLSRFILEKLEPILADWDAFARTLAPDARLSPERLRDHAEHILRGVALDMEQAQTLQDQREKSQGQEPESSQPLEAAARTHAVARMADEFSLTDLVAEFRALRASVLRIWAASQPAGAGRIEEITRFNEAIDQALAASIAHYHAKLEEARAVILGVLAHDLRSPLNAISLGTQYILRAPGTDALSVRAATRTLNSVTRMSGMVHDLLDYTRTRLGSDLPLSLQPGDLRAALEDVVQESEAAHPGRSVELVASGKATGQWDMPRIAQMMTNLLNNALEHGEADQPVRVTLHDMQEEVAITVSNGGTPIPEPQRAALFQPLVNRQPYSNAGSGSSGLGLGLYIASQIATAHKGRAELVSSDQEATVFRVVLPKPSSASA